MGSLSGNFPVMAQNNSHRQILIAQQIAIPTGTVMPLNYEKADKILVAKGDVIPLTLTVARDIRDRNGSVVIASGSEVRGNLEAVGRGVQFIAEEIRLDGSNRSLPLNATSRLVTTTETVRKGAKTQDILAGTVAGAGAATVIAAVTGDRKIEFLDVLAGAAVGTLAGWGLPTAGVIGSSSAQLYSVNPDRDLNITLQSPLVFRD
jgi:hypothetical protein